jgi:hypothetical protein
MDDPSRRAYNVYDEGGAQTGRVIMDEIVGDNSLVSCEVVCLSQTTLTSGDDDPAWSPKGRLEGSPGSPAINAFRINVSKAEKMFDPEKYPPDVCWCLYDVLVVQFIRKEYVNREKKYGWTAYDPARYRKDTYLCVWRILF